MTAPDYTRTCQMCDTEYQPTLKKDGTPRKTKYNTCSVECRNRKSAIENGRISGAPKGRTRSSKRVFKGCRFCGETFGPMLTGQARRKTYCSRECSAKAKTHARRADGTWYKPSRPCRHCATPVVICKEDKIFCSHYCRGAHSRKITREIYGLRRIGCMRREREAALFAKTVKPEVDALYRIGERIRERTRECPGCGRSHIRRYPFARHCSEACKADYRERKRKAYLTSEACRKARRIAKSRRRALMRTTQVEPIDPFDVFERDGWRCHICGEKTLRSLRGTIEDKAPELEHIIPLSKGGTHTWGNVACSCRRCNLEKSDAPLGQLGFDIAL